MSKINIFFEIDLDCLQRIISNKALSDLIEAIEKIRDNPNIQPFLSKKAFEDFSDQEILDLFTEDISVLSPAIQSFEPWELHSLSKTQTDIQYYQWQFYEQAKKVNDVYAEIAERQIAYGEPCVLLRCCIQSKDTVYIIRDHLSKYPKKSYWSEITQIDCLDKVSLERWLKAFTAQRIFKHNPKHDNVPMPRIQKGSQVSRLLCSFENAQELLLDAIQQEENSKKCHNFDKEKKLIIEFIQESPGVYHGYHLENITDTKSIDGNLSYISDEIRKKLKKMWEENQ
ncbi:MAG: hypothetical protein NW226_08910 [Microscillaceae bacterium]|nr:hypothetical protein [Microscillaceae bacterium]